MTAAKTDRAGMHIVADHETFGILAVTRTQATASYVSEGILNSFATNVPTDLPLIKKRIYDRCDPVNDYVKLNYERGDDGNVIYICPLEENLITEEFIRKRKLARLRAQHIYYQESYYRLYLSRVAVFPGIGLGTTVAWSLLNSNDDDGDYSDGILEYAEIMELDPSQAYQELKLLMDSASIVNMKYFAWYRKNVQAINQMTTEEEMIEYSRGVWAKLIESSTL